MVSTRASVSKWVSRYSQAWRNKDAKAAASLFTEQVEYHSQPFRPAVIGRDKVKEYTMGAFDLDTVYEVSFGKPVIEGSRAAVEYWGAMKESGKDVTIAGCVMLRFSGNGLCRELHDYWILKEGKHPIPKHLASHARVNHGEKPQLP